MTTNRLLTKCGFLFRIGMDLLKTKS